MARCESNCLRGRKSWRRSKGRRAIFVPPGWEIIEQSILMPAYVVAVRLKVCQQEIWILSRYCRPDISRETNQDFFHSVKKLPDIGAIPFIIGGDINRCDFKFFELWDICAHTITKKILRPLIVSWLMRTLFFITNFRSMCIQKTFSWNKVTA